MILVIGATGAVGSHVARALRDAHVPLRAFVRDGNRAAALLGDRVELAVGDFADVTSMRRALHGIDTVFLSCVNHPQQAAYEIAFIDAAVAAGVQRIVKLSAVGAEIGSPLAFWDHHGRIEEHLRLADATSVLLRPTSYMTNLLGAVDSVRHARALFAPADGARIALVDPRDVAAVAVAALLSPAHDGRTYVLTGPEAVTYHDIAQELTIALGSPVAFVDVPDDAARRALVENGMPAWLAEQLVTLFGLLRQGATAQTTDTVLTITGQPPRNLSAFIREHADLFASDTNQPIPSQ